MRSHSSVIRILSTLCLFTGCIVEAFPQFIGINLFTFSLPSSSFVYVMTVSLVPLTSASGAFSSGISTYGSQSAFPAGLPSSQSSSSSSQSQFLASSTSRFPASQSASGFSNLQFPSTGFSSSGITSSRTSEQFPGARSATAVSSSQSTNSFGPPQALTTNQAARSSFNIPNRSSVPSTSQPGDIFATGSSPNSQQSVVPVVQEFANSVSQGLLSSQTLKNFANFELENPQELVFNYGYNVLTNAGIQVPELANLVTHAVSSLGVLPSQQFFKAVTSTLAKYLHSAGILNENTASPLAHKFVDLVEDHANSNGVDGAESLIVSVADAFFDLFYSLGLLKGDEDFVKLFSLFAQEVVDRPPS